MNVHNKVFIRYLAVAVNSEMGNAGPGTPVSPCTKQIQFFAGKYSKGIVPLNGLIVFADNRIPYNIIFFIGMI